jgi:ATP-dependent RNA helicase SUPV3L1/SUV3
MLNAAITQFKLGDDGMIRYQPDASNPLPGEPFAKAVKGAKILEPDIEVIDAAGHDTDAVRGILREWIKTHVRTVLEPLVALEQADGMAEPVKGICEKLYNALGIIPREEIQSLTAGLDPEMRQVLRGKQVRLGPVLVFLPALNKPAGVKLRGLLYALWNDKPLPPPLPRDGVVSQKVDESADRDFYRAIGYPVYGPRAIRIDMLDRVISAVYDGAKDGKFQAQHKMAEWLGCQIDDLYGVLIAMGHRKIEAPVKEEKPAEETVTETPAEEAVVEKPADAEAKPEEKAEEKIEAKPAKPELAFFALKKGKAFEKRELRPKSDKPRREKSDKDKKPRGDRKHGRKDKEKKPERPRMISAEAKTNPADSPFAILGQLKKAGKDGA